MYTVFLNLFNIYFVYVNTNQPTKQKNKHSMSLCDFGLKQDELHMTEVRHEKQISVPFNYTTSQVEL